MVLHILDIDYYKTNENGGFLRSSCGNLLWGQIYHNPLVGGATKKQVLQVKRGETVVIILIIEQGINRVDLYVLLLLTIKQFVLILFD